MNAVVEWIWIHALAGVALAYMVARTTQGKSLMFSFIVSTVTCIAYVAAVVFYA